VAGATERLIAPQRDRQSRAPGMPTGQPPSHQTTWGRLDGLAPAKAERLCLLPGSLQAQARQAWCHTAARAAHATVMNHPRPAGLPGSGAAPLHPDGPGAA